MKKDKLLNCFIAIAIVLVGVICLTGCESSAKKKLTKNLEKMGKNYYETWFYSTQEESQKDVKKYVESFSKTGIKVYLDNMSMTNKADKELVDSMVNPKTKKPCDTKKSYVIIFPIEPYGKTDYKIEVNLECGF